MFPNTAPVRWCESCNKQESLVQVTELIRDIEWVHHWCIECAKLRVIHGVDTDLQDVVYFNK